MSFLTSMAAARFLRGFGMPAPPARGRLQRGCIVRNMRFDIHGDRLEAVWYGPAPEQAPTADFSSRGLGLRGHVAGFPGTVVPGNRLRRSGLQPCGLRWIEPLCLASALRLSVLGSCDGTAGVDCPGPCPPMHSHRAFRRWVHRLESMPVPRRPCPCGGLSPRRPTFFCERLTVDSIREAVSRFEAGSLREGLARYHGPNTDCAFRGWSGVWLNPEFMQWNIEAYLPNIRVPVLVTQGESDQYGTPAQVAAIARGVGPSADPRLLSGLRSCPASGDSRSHVGYHVRICSTLFVRFKIR